MSTPVDDEVYEGFETLTLTVDTTDYGKNLFFSKYSYRR